MRRVCCYLLTLTLLTGFFPCQAQKATLILTNGEVYTMEEGMPWANTIVVTGNTISAVLQKNEKFNQYIGTDTRVVDLKGKFVVPGFIDGHVHFASAGRLLKDANLLQVADEAGLKKEMQRLVDMLDDAEWITGGLWGAYEQWNEGASTSHEKKKEQWKPDRFMIDAITIANPVLLNNFNRTLFLANTVALKIANLESASLPGMQLDKNGKPTGLLFENSEAIKIIRDKITPKSKQRLLNESRAALNELRESGIVEVHDITSPEQTQLFIELQEKGELTCRIWMRADLARAQEMKDKGFTMGLHPVTKKPDSWLRYGAFKGYIDGIMGNHTALFFEPYNDRPGHYGNYRHHTSDDPDLKTPNMEKIYSYLKIANEGGFTANVHAIGTKGTSLMLDTYERLMKDLGKDLSGYRVIHAQVIRPQDFPRFKKLNVIAEVNPFHLSDDMRWMEERIGHERSKGAYAFKSLLDNGATLIFGSDWPGTMAAYYHIHPKYLIHAAVNRTTINGTPQGGWFPEQKISVHQALKAYTINAAKAAFEGEKRGSIKAGKLADITVCDMNLMKIDPKDILKMKVEMTIVDGKIVFERK